MGIIVMILTIIRNMTLLGLVYVVGGGLVTLSKKMRDGDTPKIEVHPAMWLTLLYSLMDFLIQNLDK